MNLRKRTESFGNFPYRPDKEEGRTNNGGLDLLKKPELIEEVTEVINFPELKDLIIKLNINEGLFMTLGCEADYLDNEFHGYLEFSFRDSLKAKNNSQALISLFWEWIDKKFSSHSQQMRNSLKWELDEFNYHGEFHGEKISLWYRALSQNDAGNLMGILEQFFKYYVVKLKHV